MTGTVAVLFAGLLVILGSASVAGFVLKARVSTESGRATVDNLNARIKAWWVMVAIFGAAFLFGRTVTLILFALTSFYCLREFVTLTPTLPADHRSVAASFYLFIPLQYFLIGIDWLSVFTILIPVYAFLALPALSVLGGETANFLERTAKVQWGLMLTVFCVSHAPALLMLRIPGFVGGEFLLLFFLIAVVQMSDVLQYVFGKLFGRRALSPRVSPSKTWEGLVGGGATATLLGASLFWITPFSFAQAGALSLAIVVAGVVGGLVLSAIKRSLGAKDWGAMIEGHGGALDRMDSVSFAAPIFFHLVNYFFAA